MYVCHICMYLVWTIAVDQWKAPDVWNSARSTQIRVPFQRTGREREGKGGYGTHRREQIKAVTLPTHPTYGGSGFHFKERSDSSFILEEHRLSVSSEPETLGAFSTGINSSGPQTPPRRMRQKERKGIVRQVRGAPFPRKVDVASHRGR